MSVSTAIVEEPRAREYETIYILRTTVNPDEADRIAARVREIIAAKHGKLLRVDNWGRRKLAYNIGKHSRGVFVYLRYVGLNDLVAEIERNLRLIDDVVRHQTVQLKHRVKIEEYAVDPAELEFRRLEQPTPEEEQEPELAQKLGMVDRPRGEPQDRDVEQYLDGGDDVLGGIDGAADAEDES
jgi:small subunit ribosomal protein S6